MRDTQLYSTSSYIMRDQVTNLVASLYARRKTHRTSYLRAALEIVVFAIAVSAYVAALALAA